MVDGSPNVVGEKFVAAKYSSGKVLSLHGLLNFTIHFLDACRKFIIYNLMKGLHRIHILHIVHCFYIPGLMQE